MQQLFDFGSNLFRDLAQVVGRTFPLFLVARYRDLGWFSTMAVDFDLGTIGQGGLGMHDDFHRCRSTAGKTHHGGAGGRICP